MRTKQLALAWLLFFLTLGAAQARHERIAAGPQEALEGSWKQKAGSGLLRFETGQIVVYEEGYVKALAVLARTKDQLTLRNQGLKETWRVTRGGKTLRVERGERAVEYDLLLESPPELDLTPLSLGKPETLAESRIREIQQELLRRRDLDQAVRKNPEQKDRWRTVDADNILYIKRLVQDVGWIDSARFGKASSAAAILLAKHSSDPRLMQPILALVEKDVKAGVISAELFSVLYDELQLSLGRKQRYGTQLWEDEKGPFVIPTEDPARVDKFRGEIGLPPLAEYLTTASKYLYDGKEIRVISEE